MLFKAFVKDKETKKYIFIKSEYTKKADFIYDLKSNGYAVNPNKVKPAEVFDWIIDNTNWEPKDWKYINKIPQPNENVSDWINEGLIKSYNKLMARLDKRNEERKINHHQQFLDEINMTEEQFQIWLKNLKNKKEI